MFENDTWRKLAGMDAQSRMGPSLMVKIIIGVGIFVALLLISFIIVINMDMEKSSQPERMTQVQQSSGDAVEVENDNIKDLYYYEEDNSTRYIAYKAEHTDLPVQDVVWRVNANLDEAFYTNLKLVTNPTAIPVLVNKHYSLPEDFEPADLVDVEGGRQLVSKAYAAFKNLKSDSADDGMKIALTSGYRSIDAQEKLYERYVQERNGDVAKVDQTTARPGCSEHNTGLAIDLVGPNGVMENFGDDEESVWVSENAWKYGFIVRYTKENVEITGYSPEPWHITYVGKAAAKVIHDRKLSSLEEYFVKYVWHKPPTEEE